MAGFGRWYDRFARVDFAATLIGYAKLLAGFSHGELRNDVFLGRRRRQNPPRCMGHGGRCIRRACGPCLFLLRLIDRFRRPLSRGDSGATAEQAVQPEPNIDARVAFFNILENSQWSSRQSPSVDEPRPDWLNVRFDTEIYNLLRQSRMVMRGERKICRRVLALKEKSLLRNGTKSKYCLKKFIPIFHEQSPTSGRRVRMAAMSPISASNSARSKLWTIPGGTDREQPSRKKKAVFVGVAIPPANYSKAQINKIVEAIDAFYSPLLEVEDTMISGTWLAGSLEANLGNNDRGPAYVLDQMDQS